MARRKRASRDLIALKTRIGNMKGIDPALDLGNGISVAELETFANGMDNRLGTYNSLLAQIDALSNELDDLDLQARDTSVRVLAAAAVKFGRDSREYEALGGTRASERKKVRRNNQSDASQ